MRGLSRRGFLNTCIGATAVGAAACLPVATWPDVLLAANDKPLHPGSGILVLVTLYGGNDGLNTVVPYSDDAYQDARPDLAYGPEGVLKLDSNYGLNPGMTAMTQMFKDGSLAIVRGVGYPNHDRSHFRSMDVWQSASLESSTQTGWVGRWLDSNGADPLRAIHFGQLVPQLVIGERTTAALFSRGITPIQGFDKFISAIAQPDPADSPAMRMVCNSLSSGARVNATLQPIFEENDDLSDLAGDEGNSLASQLRAVAACIKAGVPTQVYSVGLGGFDTHADERDTQQELLQKLDNAIADFSKRISGAKHGKDVVIMAYSEFGRRVRANASDGTDHGTAGPVFILGDRVKGGFYGDDPSLTDLRDGDLKVTTDFRDIYNEILLRGLNADPEPVLGKRGGNEIGFLKA